MSIRDQWMGGLIKVDKGLAQEGEVMGWGVRFVRNNSIGCLMGLGIGKNDVIP